MSPEISAPLLSLADTGVTSGEAKKGSRLHAAAQQFEALLLSEMLKAAHGSDSEGWLGGGSEAGEDSAFEMAESQFANSLASGKGLGLASVIEKAMASRAAQKVAEIPAITGVSTKKL